MLAKVVWFYLTEAVVIEERDSFLWHYFCLQGHFFKKTDLSRFTPNDENDRFTEEAKSDSLNALSVLKLYAKERPPNVLLNKRILGSRCGLDKEFPVAVVRFHEPMGIKRHLWTLLLVHQPSKYVDGANIAPLQATPSKKRECALSCELRYAVIQNRG